MADGDELKKKIINSITNLSEHQQIEIFNILKSTENFNYTENKNGIFINLDNIPKNIIDEVDKYISFCNESNNILENKNNSVLLPPEPSNLSQNTFNETINEHPISKIIKSE